MALIPQTIRPLGAVVVAVDRQNAAVELAGALDAADHAGRVDEGIDADVARPRALGRRHPVQRETPLEDLQVAGPERERADAVAAAVEDRRDAGVVLVLGGPEVRAIFEQAAGVAVPSAPYVRV